MTAVPRPEHARPTLADELTQRAAQRVRLEAYFRAHPDEEIEADTLEALAGPNYRSRFHELPFRVHNVPRWTLIDTGTVDDKGRPIILKRRDRGAYIYRTYPSLGRDAGSILTQPRLLP